MGRSPACCDESGLKKGPWTPEEDKKLVNYIQQNGHASWRALPKLAGLNRCGKSCRLRWTNYLRPDIKRGKFSQEEEETILNLHSIIGNKWSAIASHLPGRTDNEIKNFWNTHLKKKLIQMGIDPMTHRPRTDIFSSLPHLIALANLKDYFMDHQQRHHPWAEAVEMANNYKLQYLLQTPTSNINILTNSVLSSPGQLDIGAGAASLHQGLNDSIHFPARLPDLEIPSELSPSPTTKDVMAQAQEYIALSQGAENTCINSPWLNITDSPNSVTETLINKLGDQASCTSSSYEGAAPNSVWPDDHLLFEDPFFHELS